MLGELSTPHVPNYDLKRVIVTPAERMDRRTDAPTLPRADVRTDAPTRGRTDGLTHPPTDPAPTPPPFFVTQGNAVTHTRPYPTGPDSMVLTGLGRVMWDSPYLTGPTH